MVLSLTPAANRAQAESTWSKFCPCLVFKCCFILLVINFSVRDWWKYGLVVHVFVILVQQGYPYFYFQLCPCFCRTWPVDSRVGCCIVWLGNPSRKFLYKIRSAQLKLKGKYSSIWKISISVASWREEGLIYKWADCPLTYIFKQN